MPTIKPGDVFFDHLPDGRYERCVLKETSPSSFDDSVSHRKAAARGGTGEFFRRLDVHGKELTERMKDPAITVIFESGEFGLPEIVLLERVPQ